ncbi:MAG: hypothetical protein J7498_02260 [Sphingobium sp.]|nr:hypothetical protein [Sphingobium sp.]
MIARYVIIGGLSLLALALAGFGVWMVTLPMPVAAEAPPIPQAETDALLTVLTPPRRARPLVAVIGINDATETNDYLVSTGILRRADVADVVLLATGPGPVQLYPALRVQPDLTVAEFDGRDHALTIKPVHPVGAAHFVRLKWSSTRTLWRICAFPIALARAYWVSSVRSSAASLRAAAALAVRSRLSSSTSRTRSAWLNRMSPAISSTRIVAVSGTATNCRDGSARDGAVAAGGAFVLAAGARESQAVSISGKISIMRMATGCETAVTRP